MNCIVRYDELNNKEEDANNNCQCSGIGCKLVEKFLQD